MYFLETAPGFSALKAASIHVGFRLAGRARRWLRPSAGSRASGWSTDPRLATFHGLAAKAGVGAPARAGLEDAWLDGSRGVGLRVRPCASERPCDVYCRDDSPSAPVNVRCDPSRAPDGTPLS